MKSKKISVHSRRAYTTKCGNLPSFRSARCLNDGDAMLNLGRRKPKWKKTERSVVCGNLKQRVQNEGKMVMMRQIMTLVWMNQASSMTFLSLSLSLSVICVYLSLCMFDVEER